MAALHPALIEAISDTLDAYRNSLKHAMGLGIATTHADHLKALVDEYLPSGSGFDTGVTIDVQNSREDRIVFETSFHHHNDLGYTCWTSHSVIVTPAFHGVNIRVTGRDRNSIKEYIAATFHELLTERADRHHLNPWLKTAREKAS